MSPSTKCGHIASLITTDHQLNMIAFVVFLPEVRWEPFWTMRKFVTRHELLLSWLLLFSSQF